MLSFFALLAQNDTNKEGPNPLLSLAPFIIIFVLFYVLLILPAQRREKKQRQAILAALKKGDKVLTHSGIIGVVANIKDEEVMLRLEEGKMRVLKSTIGRILGPEETPKEQKPEVEDRIKK
jgi:preprotein translocase subunit YajC